MGTMAMVVFVDVVAAVVVEEGDVVEVRIMLTGTSSIENTVGRVDTLKYC